MAATGGLAVQDEDSATRATPASTTHRYGPGDAAKLFRGGERKKAQERQKSTKTATEHVYLPKHYIDFATALAGIGTFGGGITFGLLLTFSCSDIVVKQLLAYASVLFIGAILASIPVRLALHGAPED